MSDVAAFISARLDEDEQTARHIGGRWRRDGINSVEDEDGRLVVYGDGPAPNGAQADHIARHDPARVLAQVAPIRAIVDLHQPGHVGDCRLCLDAAYPEGVLMESFPCQTLGHLATIWADHEDYDPAWSPDA